MRNILEGLELFNNHDFFSAHDFFEEMWVDAERDEKLFFQGLVQISVGSYHLICNNYKGAVSQLNKGIVKLKNYPPNYFDLDLESLIIEINNLLTEIESLKVNPEKSIDINKLPRLKNTNKF